MLCWYVVGLGYGCGDGFVLSCVRFIVYCVLV